MTDSVIGEWQGRAPPASANADTTADTKAGTKAARRTVRVWDLPTRLFHWSLAASVCGALLTPHLGDTAMPWHFRCGYGALTLVLFRLVWGIVGTRHARFSDFVKGPRAIWAHVRGRRPEASTGHNPLGALSVLAMLAVVLAQAASGLLSNDDISSEGPLAQFIDKSLSDQISQFHAHWHPWLIYALIGLHIAAIAFYRLRKRVDLVKPMLTGDKTGVPASEAVEDGARVRLKALACLALCAWITWCVAHL